MVASLDRSEPMDDEYMVETPNSATLMIAPDANGVLGLAESARRYQLLQDGRERFGGTVTVIGLAS